MAKKRGKTVGDVIAEVRELRERAAVYVAVSSWLRTRYLPRDSSAVLAKITCDNSPVSEEVIEEIVLEMEESSEEMLKSVKSYESEEIEGE